MSLRHVDGAANAALEVEALAEIAFPGRAAAE